MIELDEDALRERLRPLIDDARLRDAIANISADRLLLSLFLMGLSHADGLAEAGVAAIGDDEIARLVRGPRSGRSAATRLIVEDLFPECFTHGQYRYDDHVFGREHHLTVRDAIRRRLRERGRYSPLNLHLTTTFAHDVATALLGAAVIDALRRSSLPSPIPDRVAGLLGRAGTEGGVVARHNALLSTDRRSLPPATVETIELLERLTAADYVAAAELAVREIVAAYVPYADPTALRARITGR